MRYFILAGSFKSLGAGMDSFFTLLAPKLGEENKFRAPAHSVHCRCIDVILAIYVNVSKTFV